MTTQCNETTLISHELDSREIVGRFDGGEITSDAGAMLLREVEKCTGSRRYRWSGGRDVGCTSRGIVHEGRWRIASRSSSWICLPAASGGS